MVGGMGGMGGGGGGVPWQMIAQGATSGIGDLMSVFGGDMLSRDQADSYRDALRKMVDEYTRMSQWGWGYPDWMKDLYKDYTFKGAEYAQTLSDRYKAAAPLYNEGYGVNPLQDPTNRYLAELRAMPGTAGEYQNMARDSFGQGVRGLEASGMDSRQRVSATRELAQQLAPAIQQAKIQEAAERARRADVGYNAEANLAQSIMQQLVQERAMKQQYATIGFNIPGQMQQLEMSPLQAAANIPNRFTGQTFWPGMDPPSLRSQLIAGLGPFLQHQSNILGGGMATQNGETSASQIGSYNFNPAGGSPGAFNQQPITYTPQQYSQQWYNNMTGGPSYQPVVPDVPATSSSPAMWKA